MANTHMKRYSTSLAIREIKIKTTMKFHHQAIRIAIINKARNNKNQRDCGEREPSFTFGENVNLYSHYGNQYPDSLKIKNRNTI